MKKEERSSKISAKAQMKIMEMSFMIIALVVFFVIVGLFILVISTSGIKDQVYQNSKEGGIALIARLAESPEFNCGEPLCVDADKLIALTNNQRYKTFWGEDIAGLEVRKIYPYENKTIECSIGNYPMCNKFTIIAPKNGTVAESSYVELCRVEFKNGYHYDKCEMAKITAYTIKT